VKVGIYIDQMSRRGGAQRVVSNLCHGWASRGWEVHLIVISDADDAFPVPASVSKHRLSDHVKRQGLIGLWDNWLNMKALGAVVRREKLDAVLSVSTVANIHLAFADIPARTVRVGSEHSYLPHFPLPCYKEWIRRAAYRRLDALVCPTMAAASYLGKAYPGARPQGIPNWLTWPLPKGDGRMAIKVARPGRRTFVACGRFDKLKGFSRLIRMFAALNERLGDWDLVIIGDGEDRALLEAQVLEARLRDRVFFPGWVADMESIFRSGDLFLFPSVWEGFALVLAEAMACGLPCVSYDCKVGPSEIIQDGHDGVLVPVGDEAAFSAAMLRLAEGHAARRSLAANGRAILERLSEDAIQPLWVKVLSTKR